MCLLNGVRVGQSLEGPKGSAYGEKEQSLPQLSVQKEGGVGGNEGGKEKSPQVAAFFLE